MPLTNLFTVLPRTVQRDHLHCDREAGGCAHTGNMRVKVVLSNPPVMVMVGPSSAGVNTALSVLLILRMRLLAMSRTALATPSPSALKVLTSKSW